jgi:hypothetical protein
LPSQFPVLPQIHPRALAVGEFDAGGFEGASHVIDGVAAKIPPASRRMIVLGDTLAFDAKSRTNE